MGYSAFIVDDEPKARDNLLDALGHHKMWQSLRAYSSGHDLLENVKQSAPNVVFLDIKMPGENGLQLAKQLSTLANPPLIVFVTAYSDYAVEAFELYALDYLLKPFDDSRVAKCVQKLKRVLENQSDYQNSILNQDAWANTKAIDKVVIKSSNTIRLIPIEKIHWLAANGNYVDIHHEDGKHLLRGSLKNLLVALPKEAFMQIHRGFAIKKILMRELKSNDEQFTLVLSTGEELPVGKSFYPAVLDAMVN